jgi:segregation and condensation protein A
MSGTPEVNSAEKTQFKLNNFEGPLDLLLFLIKKNEINIYDIPISEITEQYLQYLEYATKVDLENLIEFYYMAATLLYIKSRMLLPVDLDQLDDIEDPRKELVDQLIEYQKYKKLSELIAEKENEGEWDLERKKNQLNLPFEEEDMWTEIAVWDLLKLFSTYISSLSAERIVDFYEEVSINEKVSLIHELLEKQDEFNFIDLIKNGRSYLELVCSFLAVLEMAKSKYIIIYQNKIFGDIRIRKKEHGKQNQS